MVRQTSEGTRILVNPTDGSCLGTLGEKLLVVGTRSGVRESIVAKANSGHRFTANPVYKTLISRFETKKSAVVMIVAFPQASQDMADVALQLFAGDQDLAGVGPLGDLLNKIGYARGLGCAISRDGEAFPIFVSALMKDEQSAKFVAGSIGILKSVAAIVPTSGSSQEAIRAAHVFKNMLIERKAETVHVKMLMSRQDLIAPAH